MEYILIPNSHVDNVLENFKTKGGGCQNKTNVIVMSHIK